MTAQEIGTLAAQVGVPSIALAIVGKWVGRRIDAADKRAADREDECRKETKRLNQDVRNLEREVRTSIMPLVRDCTKELAESRRHNERLSGVHEKVQEHGRRTEGQAEPRRLGSSGV